MVHFFEKLPRYGHVLSVMYEIIFFFYTPAGKIDKFRKRILLYKSYINGILLIWSGSEFLAFALTASYAASTQDLGQHITVQTCHRELEYQGIPWIVTADATDPAKLDADQHNRINFLDTDVHVAPSEATHICICLTV